MNEGAPSNANQPQDPLAAQVDAIFTPADHAAITGMDQLQNDVNSAFPPDAEQSMQLNGLLNESLSQISPENSHILADGIMRSKQDRLDDDINNAVQRILNGEVPTQSEQHTEPALTQEQLDDALAASQRAEAERQLGRAADEATGIPALGRAVDEATGLAPAPELVPSRIAARANLSGVGFNTMRREYGRGAEQRRNESGQGLTPGQAAEALRDQPPQNEGPDQGPQGEQQ